MKSMTEPHIDRPTEPILSTTEGYAPKRVRWPGLLGAAAVLAVAIAGVMVTGRDDGNRTGGSPDRSTQAAAPAQPAEPSSPSQPDEPKGATPAPR